MNETWWSNCEKDDGGPCETCNRCVEHKRVAEDDDGVPDAAIILGPDGPLGRAGRDRPDPTLS